MQGRQFYIEPLSIYEHIQTKRKITHWDVHKNLPLILFSDKDNNIIIFDVNNKRPIRAFTIQQYFQESVQIKSLKFFDTNDKKYINNYEINDYVRMRGISLHLRTSLIIITLEKYICFYSYILQNFIRVISQKDLNDKSPVKCEWFNYWYCIIQTEDGNINIWNIKDWALAQVITKTSFNNKQCTNFSVISTWKEERFIIVTNKAGHIFLWDINRKDFSTTRLDNDRVEHDGIVTQIDYNPYTNILMTLSKSQILWIDLQNTSKNVKQIQNFQYCKSQKIKGVTINLSSCFNQFSYFVYGKTSVWMLIDLDIDMIRSMKLDSKAIKNFMSYSYDWENNIFQKVGDKPIKISNANFIWNTNDYLALSTNKGVVIAKLDNSYKAPIVASAKLMEISDYSAFYFYRLLNNSLIEEMYSRTTSKNEIDKYNKKSIVSIGSVFDIPQQIRGNMYHRFTINFSHDYSNLSCVDSYSDSYTIFKVEINDQLHHSFKAIKYGKGISIEWCPYASIYAVISANTVSWITKKNYNQPSSFTLSVHLLTEDKPTLLYEIDKIPCHKIFSGHFIGIFAKITNVDSTQTYPMNIQTPYTYPLTNKTEIVFYSWNEKVKLISPETKSLPK